MADSSPKTPSVTFTPQINDALPPFDKDTADVILRSADLMDFRVRKSILEEVSSVFEVMFSLPQSPSCTDEEDDDDADDTDDIAIVAMEEDSKTLDSLLRICYPTSNPDLSDTDHLRSVLKAALKYAIDYAVETIKARMRAIVNKEPVSIYAIALEFGLKDEARIAAKCSLNHDLRGLYAPELERIPGGASDLQWISTDNMTWFDCRISSCPAASTRISTQFGKRTPKKWWWDHVLKMQAVTDSKPCGKALTTSTYQNACSAIMTAALCPTCKTSASSQLESFIRSYAAEVDRVTAKISLVIKE